MSYFDEKGNIREGLLDTEASDFAKKFVKFYKNGEIDKKNSLSSSQLRRFFGEFRQLEKKVRAKDFDAVKPLIKMVKSKASYAANPKNPKIPDAFKKFLIENVDKINEEKDFKAFMLHFEAVVGFCYGLGMKND